MNSIFIICFEYNVGDHEGLVAIAGSSESATVLMKNVETNNPLIFITEWDWVPWLGYVAAIDWEETHRRHEEADDFADFCGISIREFKA